MPAGPITTRPRVANAPHSAALSLPFRFDIILLYGKETNHV